jgi:hypothetical protein
MTAAPLSSRLAPWAGWITAPAAIALNHQGLGDLIFFDCRIGNPATAIVMGLVTLALAWAGGLVSWRARGPLEGSEPGPRWFIAAIGLMTAALYSVTIIFQVLSGLIIPTCAR